VTAPSIGRLHAAILEGILRSGRAPDARSLARRLRITRRDFESGLRDLETVHGLVLHPDRRSIWIAHPFALAPSCVWVAGPERGWWAPCTWCGLGVAVLAGGEADLHLRLGGEAEPFVLRVRGGAVVDNAVVHFPFPPRDAWTNVVHWCSAVQPFRSEEEVDGWCRRHGLPRGEVVPVGTVQALAECWYGGYLRPDWHRWTIPEARAILEEVGLSGPFWDLPRTEGTL